MLQTRQAAGAFSAMTANAFTEDMEKSKEAGMDEHLSKPVDIAVLERAVRKYLVTPPPEKERPSTEIYPVSPRTNTKKRTKLQGGSSVLFAYSGQK